MPYKDPIKRKEAGKVYLKRYYWKNRERLLAQNKTYRLEEKHRLKYMRNNRMQTQKIEVLTYYGNGKCACVRCGFDDLRALSADHIEGGGCQHLKKIGRRNLYVWLKENHYPEGFQTLCMNCQWIKKSENGEQGYRLHKNEKDFASLPGLKSLL